MNDKKPEIVISGVSGRFPSCSNVDELRDKLYNGVDLLVENDERWPKGTYGLPSKSGVLTGLQNFDASFFGLTDKEADLIDPSTRFNIETTFEALCDAGLNPWDLGERRVGLFHAQMNNEIDRTLGFADVDALSSPQFIERLVAYIFNVKGGVSLYETACSSSLTTLHEAFTQLKYSCIDLAIVNCANILWSPTYGLFFHKLKLTSQEGTCRFLDSKASGYGRGETVMSVILERASDAQRVHARLISSSTNCDGYKSQGITYPSWKAQARLMSKCYKQVNIDPTELNYFECHGTGTEVGDMEEVKAIWSILGDGRSRSKQPLLLGSIKSNLGHCESGSGLPSLMKCLFIFKYNSIPPNLHYETPSPHIPELLQGFVAPVLKVTSFNGEYISINNFGFGGANGHVILGRPTRNKSQPEKIPTTPQDSILILCCGRNEISVQTMINGITKLPSNQVTLYFARLVNRYTFNMISTSSPFSISMNCRSFIIFQRSTIAKVSPIYQAPSFRAPLCFVIPGAGCQMDNMIKPFMCLKPFRESIEDSLAIIDPSGTNPIRKLIFESVQGIWQIFALGIFQIAVVDTLRFIGIEPDTFVGHSFGEFCCAYLDGFMSKAEVLDICLTLVKVITAVMSKTQTFKSCKMISIGLNWDRLSPLIPANLYPACFNAVDNITLAGLTEDVDAFADFLASRDIFFRLIDSTGCGFHTPAVNDIAEQYRLKLSHYSNDYRSLSKRWIISHKSSVCLDSPINAQTFWVETIRNEIMFQKACQSIPKNAVCVELSPKKFLTTLLRRNLSDLGTVEVPFEIGKHCKNSDSSDNLPVNFLPSLGNLYISGYPINLEPLFDGQQTGPAPVETPFLSPLIKLDHSTPRLIRRFPEFFNKNSVQENFTMDLTKDGTKHFGCFNYHGHKVIPISGLIHVIWSKFAALMAHNTNDISVRFERIKLLQLAQLKDDRNLTLTFMVNFVPTIGGKYKFTLTLSPVNTVIMTGLVSFLDDSSSSVIDDVHDNEQDHDVANHSRTNNVTVVGKDVFYGVLSRCGLHYQGDLRNVVTVNIDQMSGILINHQNWSVSMETLLQLVCFLHNQSKSTLESLTSNIALRLDEIHCVPSRCPSPDSKEVSFCYEPQTGIVKTNHIYIRGVHFGSIQLPSKLNPVILSMERFIPRFISEIQPLETSVTIITNQLIELDQHAQQIAMITCKDNLVNPSFGDLVKQKLQQRKSSPLNLIEIDSIDQLNNSQHMSRLKEEDNDIGTTESHLLIFETDKANLLDHLSPLVSPNKSNVDFIIVLQKSEIKNLHNLNESNNISFNANNHNNISINNHNGIINDNDQTYFKCLDQRTIHRGLVIVACHLTNQGYLYLIRRSIDPVKFNVKKIDINKSTFTSLVSSSTLLSQNNQTNDQQQQLETVYLLIVNDLSSTTGLIDTLEKGCASNVNDKHHHQIQLKWLINETNIDGIDSNQHFLDELMKIGFTYNGLLNGVQGSFHYLPINSKSTNLLSKSSNQCSNLNSLTLDDDSLGQLLSRSSFNSAVICSYQINCDSLILFGFSGLKDNGTTQIGLIKVDPVTGEPCIILNCPYDQPAWSLEEAATIPLPYYMAYYAAIIRGCLQTGETVLIVNGWTPVGCAITAIALKLKCTIYLTVETESQKQLIRSQFTSSSEENDNIQFIVITDNGDIEQTIKSINYGRGCDLVVNTVVTVNQHNTNNINTTTTDNQGFNQVHSQVKGNLESILKCCTIGGRCVDLNNSPMSNDYELGLAVFLKNISYHGATPEGLLQSTSTTTTNTINKTGNSFKIHQQIINLVHKGITDETVLPVLFPDSKKNNIGKIDRINCIKHQFSQHQSQRYKTNKPIIDIIFGQPGDIELEIMDKSRRMDNVSHFIILTFNKSSKLNSLSPSGHQQSLSSVASEASSSSSSSLTLSASKPSSFSSPYSYSSPSPPSSLPTSYYHLYAINQLGLQSSCSSVEIFDFVEQKIDQTTTTTKYHQVLKDISHNYEINKVFLVYRGSNNLSQDDNDDDDNSNNNPQLISQLMIELLDYVTNTEEISTNFLTLISCSLTQDYTWPIWPQLVRKCQQYGKQSGVSSLAVHLADLLSPEHPNYWFQLDQYISQLYTQLIKNNNDNGTTKITNGVYKLTSQKGQR